MSRKDQTKKLDEMTNLQIRDLMSRHLDRYLKSTTVIDYIMLQQFGEAYQGYYDEDGELREPKIPPPFRETISKGFAREAEKILSIKQVEGMQGREYTIEGFVLCRIDLYQLLIGAYNLGTAQMRRFQMNVAPLRETK